MLQTQNKNLVLINDERTALLSLSRILEREFSVRTFLDPVLAWEFLEEGGEADIVLTDLYMPRLDGISLVRYLKRSEVERLRYLPVLVSSTIALGHDVEELALQSGAAGFLPLPLRPKELLERIRETLRGGLFGPRTDVVFYASPSALGLVDRVRGLLPTGVFESRVVLEGEGDLGTLKDVELIILTDGLKNIERSLAELSVPGRVSVLMVFSLDQSSQRVEYLMRFGADAVLNQAFTPDNFLSLVGICQRQRAWYRIMERRYRGQDYQVEQTE